MQRQQHPGAGFVEKRGFPGDGSAVLDQGVVGDGLPRKKQRGPAQPQVTPVCQVEGCNTDLRGSKGYHRRHRVCEIHSKTPKSVVGGIEKRFCQQCSRFHVLEEFDDGKRSCRKRLAGHNERRRKPTQIIESGLAIVSSGKLGIYPGDFKPTGQIQHQHNQHVLDGSFLSGWPDQYHQQRQQQQQQQQDHSPCSSSSQMFQALHGASLYDISQQQQQLIQFLKSSSSSSSFIVPTLPPPPPPPCNNNNNTSSQCGALSLLSAGQRSSTASASSSAVVPPPAAVAPVSSAASTTSSSTSGSSDLYRRSSHLDSLLQVSPHFFVQQLQGSSSSTPHGLDMMVHSRSSSQL